MRTGKLYRRITQCEWEHDVDITIFFTLRKINTYITSYYTSEIYEAIFTIHLVPGCSRKCGQLIFLVKSRDAVFSISSAKGQVENDIWDSGQNAPPVRRKKENDSCRQIVD